MNFPVDLTLFEKTVHSPSLTGLTRSMGHGKAEIKDFCIPVNPYFPTPDFFDRLKVDLERTLKYYPSQNPNLTRDLADTLGLDPETIVLGNGSTELITWINRLFIEENLAIPIPTFSRWTEDPLQTGKQIHYLQRPEERNFNLTPEEYVAFIRESKARVAVLCNPNNPTGALMAPEDVVRMCDALSDLDLVVIDESFIDFADEHSVPSVAHHAVTRPNVLVLKSLGKNFGLHGVRLGYAVGHPNTVKILRDALPYWNVNAIGEFMIRELGSYHFQYEKGRQQVVRDREHLLSSLRTVPGVTAFPSAANFIYFKVDSAIDGVELRNTLLTEYGYLVRECGNKVGSSSQFFRVAARPRRDTDLLVEAMAEVTRGMLGIQETEVGTEIHCAEN